MDNREKLITLRPPIPTITEENQTSDFERFQNRSLRPILKFQNELLIEVFKNHLQKRKGVFFNLSPEKKLAYIEQILHKDQKFRNLLVGLVIGQFSISEYLFFRKEEKELSRRVSDLLIQRLQSQLEAFGD
ncbi:MAG: hypothetical protein P1U70_20105 [Saprospiraceae bacterium]|jgi:hypothetical protein|nr:hypothetical protein [Saprospiraceae bacterium]